MIGVDLVYVPEFNRQLQLGGDSFLKKVFSEKELTKKDPTHLAGLWAAKEAVMKAFNQKDINMKDILVSHKSYKPYAKVNGKKIEVSIAHHGDYAVAVAMRGSDEI
jgi:phosphopantetheine--protein transferase-like protein